MHIWILKRKSKRCPRFNSKQYLCSRQIILWQQLANDRITSPFWKSKESVISGEHNVLLASNEFPGGSCSQDPSVISPVT